MDSDRGYPHQGVGQADLAQRQRETVKPLDLLLTSTQARGNREVDETTVDGTRGWPNLGKSVKAASLLGAQYWLQRAAPLCGLLRKSFAGLLILRRRFV